MSDLPENEKDLLYYGNEQLIKTALVNILENAAKYGSSSEIVIALTFNKGKDAELCITDRGIGMDKAEVDLIFEPFYRSQNANVFKGSGIGLSLVKSIFGLHNLKYDVKSTKGRGTRFFVFFPPAKGLPEAQHTETFAHEEIS
ncbi:MAG: HAMP domain-containing histidine kinase [Saprospiraceae bacterium]|nr:HAMP domain-containing histidine kinase [Saprospiraceae bacterium]